jgi:uncharacterized protein Smg (DUF494 family)
MKNAINSSMVRYRLIMAFLREHRFGVPTSAQWNNVRLELSQTGIELWQTDALVAWMQDTLTAMLQKSFRVRILHEMEKELINTDAYGLLMEAVSVGVIPVEQTEIILEDIASRDQLPITKATMEKFLVQFWLRNIEQTGIKSSQ